MRPNGMRIEGTPDHSDTAPELSIESLTQLPLSEGGQRMPQTFKSFFALTNYMLDVLELDLADYSEEIAILSSRLLGVNSQLLVKSDGGLIQRLKILVKYRDDESLEVSRFNSMLADLYRNWSQEAGFGQYSSLPKKNRIMGHYKEVKINGQPIPVKDGIDIIYGSPRWEIQKIDDTSKTFRLLVSSDMDIDGFADLLVKTNINTLRQVLDLSKLIPNDNFWSFPEVRQMAQITKEFFEEIPYEEILQAKRSSNPDFQDQVVLAYFLRAFLPTILDVWDYARLAKYLSNIAPQYQNQLLDRMYNPNRLALFEGFLDLLDKRVSLNLPDLLPNIFQPSHIGRIAELLIQKPVPFEALRNLFGELFSHNVDELETELNTLLMIIKSAAKKPNFSLPPYQPPARKRVSTLAELLGKEYSEQDLGLKKMYLTTNLINSFVHNFASLFGTSVDEREAYMPYSIITSGIDLTGSPREFATRLAGTLNVADLLQILDFAKIGLGQSKISEIDSFIAEVKRRADLGHLANGPLNFERRPRTSQLLPTEKEFFKGLLVPHMSHTDSREALLSIALFGNPLLDEIDYTGSADEFMDRLKSQVTRDQAIAILRALKRQVGSNKARVVDDLINKLEGNR